MIGGDLPDQPFPPGLFEEHDAEAEDRRAQRIEDDIDQYRERMAEDGAN